MQVLGFIIVCVIFIGAAGFILGVLGFIFEGLGNTFNSSSKGALGGLICMMIGGGIGFAIGNLFAVGWAIFGTILGGLIAIYLANNTNQDDE